eukprot:CAMPEP_0115852024 /NCGR_PEP_ID=MMETSP0287-20121206/12780_1 /TAXON_ID=412157 /ORGANISM="Chrysochromulina rotalis, Strain UIO044" /LENGTH=262 /DNA_ID=CAMNT_0003306067 /DNA_START=29 /DNA_END=817 /DNA_ORIENTATION=+
MASCSTAFALPNPVQAIAVVSVVGFDRYQARKALRNSPLRKLKALSVVMQADPDSEEAALKLAAAVPPVFAVVEDTAYEPPVIGFDPNAFAQTLPGITAPLGFFDPVGFCASTSGADGAATEGKVRFYREVELKHGRVAMLAALGFPLAEQFHPLFGGQIDAPSYVAFQQTPLQTFWPAVVLAIAIAEVNSVFAFENPNIEGWAIRTEHGAGDYSFDPLGLKPSDPAELAAMQSKELNNGRLAMIAIAGMVGQELATGQKLF